MVTLKINQADIKDFYSFTFLKFSHVDLELMCTYFVKL